MEDDEPTSVEESDLGDQPRVYFDLEEDQQDPDESGDEDDTLFRPITRYTEYAMVNGDVLDSKEELNTMDGSNRRKKHRGGWWWQGNKGVRKMFAINYTVIMVVLITYLLAVFSIFWGAAFHRSDRLTNLKTLVVVEDDHGSAISSTLLRAINNDKIKDKLGWHVSDYMSPEKAIKEVHERRYWAAVYVSASNVSSLLEQSLKTGNYIDTSALVKAYVETGRDPAGVNGYVKPVLAELGVVYPNALKRDRFPEIIGSLTDEQFKRLKGRTALVNIPSLIITDGYPMTNPVMMAPLQVGFVFIIIYTLFQVLWFVKLNGQVAQKLKSHPYMIYRMVVSQLTFLLLSLAYTCLNRAFKVDLQCGFGVMWMLCYLIMAAVGGANENIGMVTMATLPPLTGFWLLFFVIINISGTFSPLELCPSFYRFTYMMPIKNGYELMKIVFFNTYKGDIGQYIGILLGWVVLNNILMPFCILFFSIMMKRKMDQRAKPQRTVI